MLISPVVSGQMNDDDDVTIAIDSTGIKVTNRGQWISDKWGVKQKERLSQNTRCSERKDQGNPCVGGY